MSDSNNLIAPVVDGKVQQTATKTEKESTRGTGELGKDAFLQLLVCQMQNQNPLEPNTDTEFVAQLATYSQLEQLQNLTTISEASQAFSLVGKDVILNTSESATSLKLVSGKVDFISISGDKVKLSVDGKTYDMDQLYSVLDETYVAEKNAPTIEAQSVEFNARNPQDVSFTVNLGAGDQAASNVAILFGDQLLDASMVSVSGDKVTIRSDALAALPNGTYQPTVAFNNDPYFTTISDQIELKVVNSAVTAGSDTNEAETEDGQAEQQA